MQACICFSNIINCLNETAHSMEEFFLQLKIPVVVCSYHEGTSQNKKIELNFIVYVAKQTLYTYVYITIA